MFDMEIGPNFRLSLASCDPPKKNDERGKEQSQAIKESNKISRPKVTTKPKCS
jgi:hypothetical protein